MMMTALAYNSKDLTFASVHDSFWTHACDTDTLNLVLREQFVNLYQRPVLDQLKDYWHVRYPGIHIPEIPDRGSFDISTVRDSVYFFS